MKSTRSPRFFPVNKSKRLILLTVVSLVAVAALLSFAVSANKANRAAKTRAEQAANAKSAINPLVQDKQPNAPNAAVIVATLSDNTAAATRITPGSTINYTATITNNGAASPADDATNLNFSAPLDANTTLVAGSVHASPIAFNDTYNWVGNTQLDTVARALPAVTANDVAVNAPAGTDTFTVTAIAGGATALGGVVTLASPSGSFVYTPPLGRPNVGDGATVQDSFTYTITSSADPTLTSTGTVRINLTGRVWYLVAGGVGDGRSNTPSGSPSAMSTAADKSTDVFYIFSNAGSLNGPFSVDAGQQLLGQGVNLVVSAITLFNSAAPTPTTTNTAGNCVALAGAPGNNTLSGFNIGNCTGGTAITGANVGTLNVSTMSINTNGGALDLTGVGAPTVSVVLGGTTSIGGARNVNLIGLNGTFTLAGGALSGASGNALHMDGGTAGLTYSGTISNSTARQVNIINKTGGTVALSGAIGGTGTGIFLNANNGATLNFTGGIALSTGTNAAFTATGPGPAATSGGTVNVTQNNTSIVNTLTTTTGAALNVANTTIGASGLTFRSIAVTGNNTLPTNGIVLNNTGTSAGLTVVGNGSAGTGGTITATGGNGVQLTTTEKFSLSWMSISSNKGSGIGGSGINGFQLANCTLNTNGDDAAADESGINVTQLTGTASGGARPTSITNCTIQNNWEFQIQITNSSGTLTDLTMSGNTISTTAASGISGDLFNFLGGGTSVMKLTVTSGSFTGNWTPASPVPGPATISATAIAAVTQGTTHTVNVSGATFTNNNAGVDCSTSNVSTTFNCNVSNNNFQGTRAIAINSFHNGNSPFTRTFNGTFNNNIIGTAGNANSASFNGRAIDISNEGAIATANYTISGNTIREVGVLGSAGAEGIGVNVGLGGQATGGGTTNVTISNNNIDNIRNSRGMIVQDNQDPVFAPFPTICANITGNTFGANISGQAGNGQVLRLRRLSGTVQIPQASQAALEAANTGAAGKTSFSGTITFNGPVCTGSSAMILQVSQREYLAVTVASPKASDINWANEAIRSATSTPGGSQPITASVRRPMISTAVVQISSKDAIAPVRAKATPKATAAEVARIYQSERPISHHAIRKNVLSQDPNAPTAGENVTLNTIATFPAGGKSITIKYSATVNTTVLTARQATTQGTVTANAGAINVTTDDPDVGGTQSTVTLLDTTLTWTGATDTNWNTVTNWNRPGPVVSSYAPGIANPGVNDVVIPNVGTQPAITATDINIFSLNESLGRTLTIDPARTLTINGGGAGSDLSVGGNITGGAINFAGAGPHAIIAGALGTITQPNLMTTLSPAVVTLNNDFAMGSLAVNSGATMNISNRVLTLRGAGAALSVPAGATFTVTGSTVVFNGSAAQTTGTTYNNLTINNAAGVTLTSSSIVNGTLALTAGDLNTGAFTLTQPNTTASTGTGDVVGTVIRSGGPFALATPLTFGNPNNIITFTGAGTRPTTMTVVMAKAAPATFAAAVQRNYTMSQTGGSLFTATVRLHYLDSELNGNLPETSLGLRRLRPADSHWVAAPPPPGVPTRDGAANWIEAAGVLAADLTTQWTFSALVPTASGGTITGRIVDQNGNPVEGAVVRLEGTQNRKFITDANGVYSFDNVETNGFYTVTPSRANYSFTPSTRSFSQLGETTEAAFGATLVSGGFVNPLDTPEYFVRQHYIDFLGREPDEAGFNFWSDQILECAGDVQCTERRRENVSAAYFLSIEFRKTGGLVDGLYRASYGVAPQYAAFMPDTRTVGLGVQVGKDGWEELLRANTEAFVNSFVNRPEFHQLYDGMDNSLFVDTLISHTGVTFRAAERDALVSGLGAGTMTRAEALRSIAENTRFVSAKFNQTFVMMEYYGYLRRDYDPGGYAFWLNKLNEFNGNFEQAEMVKAFIVSGEYRDRFAR